MTIHDTPRQTPTAIRERLEHARVLAQAAGEVIMTYFDSDRIAADTKPDGSPVTIADKAAETIIRHGIKDRFAEDALLGEEHGGEDGTSGYTWVIDPIDGTVSFMHGVPVFGTLIGIECGGVPVAGVMHFPALDESAWAAQGSGAWHRVGRNDPTQVHVSKTDRLDDAMVCTTSFDYFRGEPWEDAYLAVAHAAKRTRGWSDCHSELLLVTGRIDAVIEPVLNPWDISAIIAILNEAGGTFTDWRGDNESCSANTPGLASNGAIHHALLEVLSPWKQ